MNSRIWGIIGGVALVLALLSPLLLGNANKIKQLFEEAEMLYERRDYKEAIVKYKESLKESKKLGANTERIDTDFTTLVNLKIAWCYYELGERTSDVRHNQNALTHIKADASDTQVLRYQEELTYLWAENLYKIDNLNQARSKFEQLIQKFPKSQWVPKARYTLAEIAYQQDNCEKALNILQELATEFPESELIQKVERRIVELNAECNQPPPPPLYPCEEMYKTAFDLKQQGKNHDAYKLSTNLIEQFPDSEYVTYAYELRAEIHCEAKDPVNARANYEEAIYSTADAERKKELYEAYHCTYLVIDDPDPDPVIRYDDLFVIARLLRLEERWSEAAEIYVKLTDRNLSVEDMTYSLYWKGRCYYKAAQKNPKNPTLFSKSVDALTTLTRDYENSEYDFKSYYYLTLVYTDWAKVPGNDSKCQSVIDTVKQADPKYKDNNDSTVQELLGRMRKLEDEARKKLLPPPPDPDIIKEAIEQAEAAITKATQENADPQIILQANRHLERAKHEKNKTNSAAIDEANEVLELLKRTPLPPDCQDYVDEGNAYLEQSDLENAWEKAERALDLDRNCTPAHELKSKIKERYVARGKWFFEEEKYDEAIKAFNNAISINIPLKFKEPHNYLGIIYFRQEKYREAIDSFSKAIGVDANFKEAYFNLALAHLELDEREEAISAANVTLRIDPNYEPARMLIEFIAN